MIPYLGWKLASHKLLVMLHCSKAPKITPQHAQQTSRAPRPWCSRKLVQFAALALVAVILAPAGDLLAASLRAGTAKVDITDREAGPVNDPLYAKALVISDGEQSIVIITVDAVAVGEIGYIGNDYLPTVRERLRNELKLAPTNVLINASHCHGVVCSDVAERTIQAVREAQQSMVPVAVGVGTGHEDRVSENRRLKLKNGREVDVRHAYSMPADEDVAAVGPIDPEIGILRLDRLDGTTLAVVYNFACHPILGVPSGGNTADLTGFASRVLEEAFGNDTMALFIQGCAGDINPAKYKDVNAPRDAEAAGNLLGLSTLRAAKRIQCVPEAKLSYLNETIELPRADLAQRIQDMKLQREALLSSLRGTSLNLKTYIPLVVRYGIHPDYPSYYSHAYLHEEQLGRDHLRKLDAENRRNMELYTQNIRIMEELTRVQTNLALLEKHQAQHLAAGRRTLDVELAALRIGDFVLLTFPGELTVQIGLNIKSRSPHEHTFVAGYTNGYIYYAPTAEQLANVGGAQEDSDSLLAPEWQEIYEIKAAEMLQKVLRN